MDPVSHCLVGRAFGCLDTERRLGRGSSAAFVLGSIAPDADSVLAAFRWDMYLRVHEVGTHTLIMSPLVATAVAAVLTLTIRRAVFSRLLIAAWIGVVVGHIGFDLVSGSDIRTLVPFWSDRVGLHLLAMGDLSALAIIVVGTLLTFWKRRAAAIGTLVALAVLLGVKAVSYVVASDVYRTTVVAHSELPVVQTKPESVSGSLWAWRFYDQLGDQMRGWRVNARSGDVSLDFVHRWPDSSEMVNRSYDVPVVRNFLTLATLPFPRVESSPRGQAVHWSDLKFCRRSGCAVSFGVTFGPDLVPHRQVIDILGYRQTRTVGGMNSAGQAGDSLDFDQ